MNRAMQVTIAKAVLAGYRIEPDQYKDYWLLYTPNGAWVGRLFDTRYTAAKTAVEMLEASNG